jgi:hypothetical protein
LDLRLQSTEFVDQIRAMQITARLAGGKKDFHVNAPKLGRPARIAK